MPGIPDLQTQVTALTARVQVLETKLTALCAQMAMIVPAAVPPVIWKE